MKRYSFLAVLVFLVAQGAWSDQPLVGDYAGDVGDGGIAFLSNSMMDFAVEANGYSEVPIPYRLEQIGALTFLRWGKDFERQDLILISQKLCFVFRSEKRMEMEGILFEKSNKPSVNRRVIGESALMRAADQYAATSELKDGGTVYSASNLGNALPGKAWAVRTRNSGIGETVRTYWTIGSASEITAQSGFPRKIGALVFSNGYVSYDRPDLYLKNNRVRALRISSDDGKYDFAVNIPDTPNPLVIPLPKDSAEVTIEIRDVYKGTKWNDTCVNFIKGVSKPLADFLSSS